MKIYDDILCHFWKNTDQLKFLKTDNYKRFNNMYIINNIVFAGTPGNRTQLPDIIRDSGVEDHGGHQPHNHSQY